MTGAITLLLVCQMAGELLARLLHLPVPGPAIGMVLLFAWLLLRHGGEAAPPEALTRTGEALLNNMGLLFVPAGVGVVAFLPVLARNWAPISVAVIAGTMFAIALTGRLTQALLRRMD